MLEKFTVPLAGFILAFSAFPARAGKSAVLANHTSFKMVATVGEDLQDGSWFTLQPMDLTATRKEPGATRCSLALDAFVPMEKTLWGDRALRFGSEQPDGCTVSFPFVFSCDGAEGIPAFQFKVLFTCNTIGAEPRSFIGMDEDPLFLETLPFTVNPLAPDWIVLEPRHDDKAHAGGAEGMEGALDPGAIEPVLAEVVAPAKGCCVIL